MEARRRDQRLERFEHWDEIELRLRHRWPPRKVVGWHEKRYPGQECPSIRTLYRCLEDKAKEWYADSVGGETEWHAPLSKIMVLQELRWLAGIWAKAIDVSYHVAEGNTRARANVVLDDGTVLFSAAPATALLELEKRVGELRELLSATPTLDPAKGFRPDPGRGKGIYQAREVQKTRTQKVQKPIVLYPATPEHPAQTNMISVDEPIGKITEQEWSGLITPAQKSAMLARAEELQRALKAALHRANTVELEDQPSIAKKVFDFVLGTD